jgi:hypothetical protein
MRTGTDLLLGRPGIMPNAQPDMICGPETLKMLYGVYEDVVQLALAERPAVSTSEDLALRRRIGEILLTNNPIALRRRTLEKFGSHQRRS